MTVIPDASTSGATTAATPAFVPTPSPSPGACLDPAARERLEAAAFRRLVAHLGARPDVQNIDLMNLAGFCRNCLSRWLAEEATAQRQPLDLEAARHWVYGMPYAEWKARHQTEASPAARAAFAGVAHDAVPGASPAAASVSDSRSEPLP